MSDDLPPGYAEAVGLVTIAWARLEAALDIIVEATFHRFGGREKHKEIPRSLSRKLAYLRERTPHVPTRFALRLTNAINAAEVHKNDRHTAIHAALAERGDESVTLIRFFYEKTSRGEEEVTLSVSDLHLIYHAVWTAADSALDLVIDLCDFIGKMRDDTLSQ